MSGKSGMKHANPGPRVTSSKYPVGAEPDPAMGAKVPRCRACGLPNPRDLIGTWEGRSVRFPLCKKCIAEVNGPEPMDTDPLYVEAA